MRYYVMIKKTKKGMVAIVVKAFKQYDPGEIFASKLHAGEELESVKPMSSRELAEEFARCMNAHYISTGQQMV